LVTKNPVQVLCTNTFWRRKVTNNLCKICTILRVINSCQQVFTNYIR